MALSEAKVAIKFAGGIETKMDSKSVPAAKLLALENGVFTKAISIQKRNGYSSLSRTVDGSVTAVTGLKKLAARDNELLAFTASKCYSHQTGTDQWTDVGSVFSVPGTERDAVHTGTQQLQPDHATAGGVTAYAWEDSTGGVWWTVEDATTGAVHRAPTQANSLGQRPRCVAVNSLIHIYYAVPSLGYVYVIVVNPAQPTASVTPVILVDDLHATNPVFDACPTTRTNTPAAIAWHEAGTTNYRVGYVDASGVLGSPATGHPSVARFSETLDSATPIGVAYQNVDGANGDYLAVTLVGTGTCKIYAMNGGTTTVGIGTTTYSSHDMYTPTSTGPSSVQRATAAVVAGVVWGAYEETAVDASNRFIKVNSATIGGAPGTATTQRSLCLASRAFLINGDVFAYFVHDTTYFNVYLALRLSDFICVARQCSGGASGRPNRTHLSSAHVASNVVTTTLPFKQRLESSANDKFGEVGLRQLRLDFASTDTHHTAQLGLGLYMGGACAQHYDGRVWTEQSFHVGPEVIVAVSAGGGSMTSSGTFLYRAWYEWTDAQGEVHRGPESFGTSVTLGGADTQVTLTLPTLRVTKKTGVRICVARSLNGDTTQLFRVSSLDPTTSGAAANRYIPNDATVDTVTFVDRFSDTTARAQEPHYTNGGVLSNDPTQLGAVVAGGKNRLFFTDAADGNKVRYSQELAEGFGLEMAPQLFLPMHPFGGDVTGLAIMDDVVYVFKASAIFAFNGDGPLPTGDTANSGFSAPQLISSDVGCEAPRSIVLTPAGLMFQSAKGIYMLGRDRQVNYVGAPAESYNSQDVRRAMVMPNRNQVLFLTSSGKSLLYDFQFGQWSTFTNHEGLDAAVVSDTYHYLRSDSRVFSETIGSYSDAGVRITLRFETAWLHLWDHLQGLQRFWKLLLLGTWSSPHQLGVQYRTDYETNWTDTQWLDATGEASSSGWITGNGANTIGVDPITGSDYGDGAYGDEAYGGTQADIYQWRVGLHTNGQSIQFRFEDFEKAGLTGASFELTEMTIIGGVMKPDARPFTAARSR